MYGTALMRALMARMIGGPPPPLSLLILIWALQDVFFYRITIKIWRIQDYRIRGKKGGDAFITWIL